MYHPIDVQYSLLSCSLNLLNSDSDKMHELIEQAMTNTHADSHSSFKVQLQNIMSIGKGSEKMRFLPFDQGLQNKFLLWYPVSQSSLANILRNGLRIPGAEVPGATFRHGKGLYFTDCASKAIMQSMSSSIKTADSSVGYVLLCEVALGDMHKTVKPGQVTKPP